jgi:hypothetical protein
MVIEIENALSNDFRVRYEPLTDIETFDQVLLTPVKVHELALAHERLVTNYLNNVLGEPMTILWRLTIGLLEHKELDAAWMDNQLTGIHAGDAAQSVKSIAYILRENIKQDAHRLMAADAYIEDQFGVLCDLLEAEDRRVIRDLKLALREGVMVFEALEQDTILRGTQQLVAVLQNIPLILEGFYDRLRSNLNT